MAMCHFEMFCLGTKCGSLLYIFLREDWNLKKNYSCKSGWSVQKHKDLLTCLNEVEAHRWNAFPRKKIKIMQKYFCLICLGFNIGLLPLAAHFLVVSHLSSFCSSVVYPDGV